MNKSEVAKLYSMEELIPTVGKLAEQFTSKESSSVTYERASQLMAAVLYCIAHFDSEKTAVTTGALPSAEEAYCIGYEAVIKKVSVVLEKYNRLMTFFDSYGNWNYRDTVEKAIPGFFLYYDVKFAPMENGITYDYPILGLDTSLEGIDRMEQYIDAIWQEQQYLREFSREYVIDKLLSFHPRYEREYFNLREIMELK